MNLKMRSSALVLCLSFGLVAAAQAAEPGWYLVGFGGESSASGLSQGQMDGNLEAIFASVGLDVVDATFTLDDSDTASASPVATSSTITSPSSSPTWTWVRSATGPPAR